VNASGRYREPRSIRTRLIFSPIRELRRQRGFWVQLVGERAARPILRTQAVFAITVWLAVAFWIVALSGAIAELVVGDDARAKNWVIFGAVCNLVIAIIGAALTRAFVTSAARMLLPSIAPLDAMVTLDNLAVIIRAKPSYFAALARKHPGSFPPV
jgi:hypothetical protein